VNLNITKKEPEKYMFHGWIFKKRGFESKIFQLCTHARIT